MVFGISLIGIFSRHQQKTSISFGVKKDLPDGLALGKVSKRERLRFRFRFREHGAVDFRRRRIDREEEELLLDHRVEPGALPVLVGDDVGVSLDDVDELQQKRVFNVLF